MDKTFDKELKRGTLEMILLKMLAERPMYGYELVSTLEQRGGAQFHFKEGTLYPVLYRLEDAGYIRPEWETPERGVPRKYYHITSAGRQQLEVLFAEWHEFTTAVSRLLSAEYEEK